MSLAITYKEGESICEKCGLDYQMVTGSVAFDSSYPTNGEAMDMSKIFPRDLHMVMFAPTSGYIFEYDYANKKVKAFYADYDAGADGALIEVANGEDLSGLSDVRFVAIGK